MTYTIQDLRDGKCAVVNDGTVDELNRLLDSVTKYEGHTSGLFRYYWASGLFLPSVIFTFGRATTLPTQSVHEFLKQL